MATLYEQIKSAWDSGTIGSLDRTAEEMARRGVAETDIYAALEELLLAVRETGADDETEERINEVMDRLTGWCHPSNHIRTARDTLPTEDEIAKLPRWARVAFAARCARRGESVYHARCPGEQLRNYHVVNEAIETVERMAADGRRSTSQDTRHLLTDTELQVFIRNVVLPAYLAAWQFFNVHASSLETADAALATANAMMGFTGPEIAKGFVRSDFDHLADLVEQRHWTDDTPVPPDVFGPLWPEGPPKGWPTGIDSPQEGTIMSGVAGTVPNDDKPT